jgi:hypothetical protein
MPNPEEFDPLLPITPGKEPPVIPTPPAPIVKA